MGFRHLSNGTSSYSFTKLYCIRLISAPLLYNTQNWHTLPIKSAISSLIMIQRVFLFISCPNCNWEKSTTKAFLFLVYQCDYRPIYSSNELYFQSFLLAFQSIPIRVSDGCQISPKTFFRYLVFLALTLLKISLKKVSLKVRLAQCCY